MSILIADKGLIIDKKQYSENSSIVKIFSSQNGIFSGFLKQRSQVKDSQFIQAGNLISFEYKSRNESDLGQFLYVDFVESFISQILFSSLKLSCVNSLFSIFKEVFSERENQEILFEKLYDFLRKISDENSSENDFLSDYIKLELFILETLGYALDLTSCAATNSTENLVFVSPKSARAVSFDAGKNYADKLLKLPQFLVDESLKSTKDELLQALDLTNFFLKKFLFFDKDRAKSHHLSHKRSISKNIEKLNFS